MIAVNHTGVLAKSVLEYKHSFQEIIKVCRNYQLLKRDMDQLDAWLNLRKPVLEDKSTGDSIDAVEELLQKHDDFEKMVFAQEDRFNNINRITLVYLLTSALILYVLVFTCSKINFS